MTIDKEAIKKRPSVNKIVGLCIKIPLGASDFLKKENISPTGLFNEALKEVGYTGDL